MSEASGLISETVVKKIDVQFLGLPVAQEECDWLQTSSHSHFKMAAHYQTDEGV